MDFVSTLGIAMGAAWVSGINLYATVATLGLLSRFANLRLPGELESLTSWWVIGVAAALYVIEFIADKVPVFDSFWDVVHTFIRIPAGAALAATAFGDYDRSLQVIAFLIGGGIAFTSHGAKASTRAAINTSPEPVSNITASLVEDGVAFGSILLAVFYPIAIIVVVIIFVIASIFILPKIFSFLRRAFSRFRRATG